MAIHVALHHRTHYLYDRKVAHAPHILRLRPAPHCRTRILSYSQKIAPAKHFMNWQQDPFGNHLARAVFPDPTNELCIDIDLIAEMDVFNPFDFFLEEYSENFPFVYEPWLKRELSPFLECHDPGPLLKEFIASIDMTKRRTIDFLVDLNRLLYDKIKYLIRLEPGVQTPEETLKKSSGSCRDSAWLLATTLRNCGLATRFASGYLLQLKPDVESLDGPSGASHDFTDLHAWCEVYLPGAGWIGLDPTSGLLAGEGHIPLACTPEPSGASPVTGAIDDCKVDFKHEMRISRVYESPRVTKPYSEEQWKEIRNLGEQIDRELKASDIRLTMGGEPTFISIDNMDGLEWNFAALGPEKRKLADELVRRLKDRFAPKGLLHHGQGKWYPGESLPRWAFSCVWRKDGQPIWHDGELFAKDGHEYGYTDQDSAKFIDLLARVLDVDGRHVVPAFEDAWYYMWRERRLPTNVDPLKSNLSDKEERARFAKVFEQGLNKTIGHVLPIRRNRESGPKWMSGAWFLRREHLFLTPGDSPMGFRLPLDSIPWVSKSDYPYLNPTDPLADLYVLPEDHHLRQPIRERLKQLAIPGAGVPTADLRSGRTRQGVPPLGDLDEDWDAWRRSQTRAPGDQESAGWVVRTALCVEPRGGKLHVFMPPVPTTEDYLDLVAAIEETASTLGMPVVLEGEAPPYDPRLNSLKITPDPGVIEVNLPPSGSWKELDEYTTTLYEEARLSRLGTEKFMIDGRHVGTGGGNHIVLGGSTPSDSPFLRRPDLLRSLLGYWQNHPALSFVFSSLFIGPTSQHPRVDEARNDSLYELEVAFKQIPESGDVPPWLVDRLFRNLLIDSSGNTHRAEFSIDKLYSPDSSSGRLGLVEMRAFEMPPHSRMSLAQQLLIRALISRFWKYPYNQKLVRWNTEIHDRFMLPHFNEEDFRDVVSDLNDFGIPVDYNWFLPHMEFRFPTYGKITRKNVSVEVRQALEPWHVLGEQSDPGGTVRYVDSSLDRLQVKVRGLVDSRHVVTCNRRRVPLHPTGVEGEYVAGVRYRGWQPSECLHPTIGVHSPLVFDIVDTWNGRSIGGCTYHVSHPGGRNYVSLPVNAYEAESRRLSRFFDFGHTPGPMEVPPADRNQEFPFTLDLRHV